MFHCTHQAPAALFKRRLRHARGHGACTALRLSLTSQSQFVARDKARPGGVPPPGLVERTDLALLKGNKDLLAAIRIAVEFGFLALRPFLQLRGREINIHFRIWATNRSQEILAAGLVEYQFAAVLRFSAVLQGKAHYRDATIFVLNHDYVGEYRRNRISSRRKSRLPNDKVEGHACLDRAILRQCTADRDEACHNEERDSCDPFHGHVPFPRRLLLIAS